MLPVSSLLVRLPRPFIQPVIQTRNITKLKRIKKQKKAFKLQQKERLRELKLASRPEAVKVVEDTSEHEEWVEFQKSIAVKGFETGQNLVPGVKAGKQRGGKRVRKKKEKMLLSSLDDVEEEVLEGGGHYPPETLPEEETIRLLKEAYGGLPERTGPRRSRHLKREKLRMEIKRAYDKKKKHERMMEHSQRMLKRSSIAKAVQDIKKNAPAIVEEEEEYREESYRMWAKKMIYALEEEKEGIEKIHPQILS